MKQVTAVFFTFLTASLVGCSPAVYTDQAEGVDFGTYQTFAMLPTGKDMGDNTIYTEKIINEVHEEMRARGYELDADTPDLLVNVKTMYEEEEELVSSGFGGTYNYYTSGFYTPTTMAPYYYTGYTGVPSITGTGIREVEYTEGTFVVDVIEATEGENELLWRGWSETPVDPANVDESIRDYVENIFDEYPVEKQDD